MALKTEDAHHVSIFPPILDCYLSAQCPKKKANPVEFHRQRRHHSCSRLGQVVMSRADAENSDQVLENKQKALLDQRHLETYYRIHRLKDVLSHQYATLLEEKVQKQRQEMKSHHTNDSKTTQRHKEQTKKRKNTQRLTRSILTHDDTYISALPKTRCYMVVELQSQLTRLGCLQFRRDQEVFRVWLEQHRSIYHLEKQLQAMELNRTSRPDVTLEDLLKHKTKTLPKLQISHEDATAHQENMPVSLKGTGGGAIACQLHGKQRQGQDETELMFPEVFTREFKVPKFSVLRSTFLNAMSTNMPYVRSDEPPIKSRSTDIIRHKLRFMHNLSRSHIADTKRIMAKNRLSLQCTDGFSIKELMEYEGPHEVQIQKSRCSSESDLIHEATTESPESLIENPTTQISLQFADERTEDSSSSAEATDSSDTDVPLSIHNLYTSQMGNSEEKMWINYI
ncbi:uncharacterized protein [Paramisgurnus dabryanus]|uniref:uncharacterized protein isoform X2 n=1 Tax=Paramisgurnus dabryanus TaxID=90735 RepID=UPI0031F35F24